MSGYFRASVRLALVLPAIVSAACNYGLTGGGGFPADIRTVFIAPLGDEEGRYDVSQEVFMAINEQLPRALGLRLAGEEAADAIIRGSLLRYEDVAQNYRPGEPGSVDVLQHQVQITMSIQIIDVRRNIILYEQPSISGRGEYRPDEQSAQVGRVRAIETLIQQIINGAQSQW